MSAQVEGQDYLLETETTEDQEDTERECKPFFVDLEGLPDPQIAHLRQTGLLALESRQVCLMYEKHADYMKRAFGTLSHAFVSLDASRPWMLYWTLNGCDLLGDLPDKNTLDGIITTLQTCWQQVDADSGGFGGGPGQMAHCATTYASVLALSILATTSDEDVAKRALRYLEEIRQPLLSWFLQLQAVGGGYHVHFGGETDVRATYLILSCAKLLNIVTPELASQPVADYCKSCQTFEGGFGGEPGSEAHGGYTFCVVAALQLMNKLNEVDVPALRGWLVRRQMAYEGGFQGRSNKLVDGCYSFWQGGAIAIMSGLEKDSDDPWLEDAELPSLMYTEGMLQRYILMCGQDVNGGLRDKPSKPRDFYHSSYVLAGLSVSQHCGSLEYGHPSSSLVAKTHPVYNIRVDRAASILEHFTKSFPDPCQ